MPTIPIDYGRVHTTQSIQRNPQAMPAPRHPVLNNLESVRSSALSIAMQEEMDNFRAMVQADIRTIGNEMQSNKPLTEKLPVYINNERKIRLATRAIERFYSVNPNATTFSADTGRDRLYKAVVTQLKMYNELQRALPPDLDNRLRLKIMDNIFIK